MEYLLATSAEHLENTRQLFTEYAASLDFDLCFQNFEGEMAGLPGEYGLPGGCIVLAMSGESPAGCVAMKKLEDGICEMKRLYVKPEFRGQGVGKELATRVIDKARECGYSRMRLDTVPSMKSAIELYRELGFKETSPYTFNPIDGAIYMEIEL